jgi:RNA polymerase sigma factor (sigma-70 family)
MDDEELQAALETHHRESFGWALHCCGRNPADAEEVLQTVYLKILDGRAKFAGQSSFKTWLLALIRNTAIDEWRRRNRRTARLSELEKNWDPIPQAPPGDRLDQREMHNALTRVLDALPPRQREVLRLVFYHDLSVAQAALVMGVSLGAARTHYERGKARARQVLEASEIFDEFELGRQ